MTNHLFNVILVSYRDRPQQLETLLYTYSKCASRFKHELALIDLGSDKGQMAAVLAKFPDLPINHLYVDYHGPFWKTKALNYGLRHYVDEYGDLLIITHVDVDALLPSNFLLEVEKYHQPELDANLDSYDELVSNEVETGTPAPEFSEMVWTKLAFPVHLIDRNRTEWLEGRMEHFYMSVVCNPHMYEKASESYDDAQVGNSHFSICAAMLEAAGGWDERFVGYGLEDVELNMRLEAEGVPTVFANTAVFHKWHERTDDRWYDRNATEKNREHLEAMQAQGWPSFEPDESWGEFPSTAHQVDAEGVVNAEHSRT